MVDQLKGKRVPLSHLEEYLILHKNTIVSFQDQLNSDMMDIPEIEAKLPKSFS